MILNSSNLKIFEAVARQQSFSRAAQELAVSQPYVSTQIAELEAKLDLILFRRVGRRVYLTDAGNQLYTQANNVLTQLASAEEIMAGLRCNIVGRLECATTIVPAEYILPSFLESLIQTHPSLQVDLRVSGSREVESSVLRGQYELGITLSETIPEGLDAALLGRDELAIVVAPTHPFSNQASVSPAELSAETLLVREASSATRVFIESIFERLGLEVRYGPEFNNNEVIKAMVTRRLGIAILSTRAVNQDVRSGRLRALTLSGVNLYRPITLIERKQQALTKPALIFKTLLISYCSSHLDQLQGGISQLAGASASGKQS